MKKIMRVMSLVLMALIICTAAFADALPTVGIQNVSLDRDVKLNILVHSTVDSVEDTDSCFAELDGQRVNIESVEDYWKTEKGTTWLFLVDTATVSTTSGTEKITDLLNELIDGMEEEWDNAALIATGTTFSDITLTNNADELKSKVKSLHRNNNVKTLYATVAEAVTYLDTHADVKPHASLVIISTGETNSEEGMTVSELQQMVEDSNITVYTVAYSSKTDSAALTNYLSLARKSCGGLSIKVPSNTKADDIISQIKTNERQFRLMTTESVKASGEQLKLYVSHNDKYLEDTFTLNRKLQENIDTALSIGSDVIVITPEPTTEPTPIPTPTVDPSQPTPEPTIEPTPEPTPVPNPWIKDNWMIVLIGGMCVLLMAVIVVLLVALRRPAASDNGGDDEPPEVPSSEGGTEPADAKTLITLTEVGSGICFKGELKTGGQLIVGRAPETPASIVLDIEDSKISRKHFILHSVDGMIMIENIGRNGTRVNNAEIHQKIELHQQDVISVGVTDLRISWMKL